MHGENSGWCFGHSGILDTVAKILSGINVGWRFGHSGVLDTVVFWSQWPKPCMSILTKWWIDPCQSMTVSMWLMSMHLITATRMRPVLSRESCFSPRLSKLCRRSWRTRPLAARPSRVWWRRERCSTSCCPWRGSWTCCRWWGDTKDRRPPWIWWAKDAPDCSV